MKDELISLRARFEQGWPESIACGPGWTPLLLELDARLSAIAPDYRIYQVKEKFGGLRFYAAKTACLDDENCPCGENFFGAIRDAEAKSFRTCEECGGVGVTGEGGRSWVRTLCAECAPEGWEPYGNDD